MFLIANLFNKHEKNKESNVVVDHQDLNEILCEFQINDTEKEPCI
jgi:hypothetical protein